MSDFSINEIKFKLFVFINYRPRYIWLINATELKKKNKKTKSDNIIQDVPKK